MPMTTTSLLKKFKIIEDNAEIVLNSEYRWKYTRISCLN